MLPGEGLRVSSAMAAAGARRPFACDVPDCLCRYRVYLQTKKRRGLPQKIVGEVYGATHPVSQRIEVWVMQADSDDAVLPTGSKSICFRCSCQAHKEIMQELGNAPPDSPGDNTRAKHSQIRKEAESAREFYPRSKRKFSELHTDTKGARMKVFLNKVLNVRDLDFTSPKTTSIVIDFCDTVKAHVAASHRSYDAPDQHHYDALSQRSCALALRKESNSHRRSCNG